MKLHFGFYLYVDMPDSDGDGVDELNHTNNIHYQDWIELVEKEDYTQSRELGFIRHNTQSSRDMIAVHYTTGYLDSDENKSYMGTSINFDECERACA